MERKSMQKQTYCHKNAEECVPSIDFIVDDEA